MCDLHENFIEGRTPWQEIGGQQSDFKRSLEACEGNDFKLNVEV